MKRLSVLLAIAILFSSLALQAKQRRQSASAEENVSSPGSDSQASQDQPGRGHGDRSYGANDSKQAPKTSVINLGHPGRKRNVPSESGLVKQPGKQGQGHNEGKQNGRAKSKGGKISSPQVSSPEEKPGNVANHQRPFTAKEIKTQFDKLGIKSAPQHIAERAEILDSDRKHSEIRFPEKDNLGKGLPRPLADPKAYNEDWVRGHMREWGQPARMGEIQVLIQNENGRDHYYWHQDHDQRYCHYVDTWGFHWCGWYIGERCFWTRYYSDRWWFYDPVAIRWCFWNDGGWWWQDPWHVGDLYVYADGQYIPSSAAASQNVSMVEPSNTTAYRSPDDTRLVKIMPETGDAFLYDTEIPPAFNPIYLASKVQGVKFSDTGNGQPLQIMLSLSDGTTDIFDDRGRPLNFRDAVPSR